ncbi:cysteine-rich venom protein 6-like isoform X4 [Dermacentor silvarum]|uniref:cysteine-rich venom protein 6-like isoform X4 n=1 Tax=Dermacentor silvarum TaxID=543639 RepID=UPI002100BCBD|nr:cysteine-rich venom protein 6-like isoform X4 [Dermacentor silvarum]
MRNLTAVFLFAMFAIVSVSLAAPKATEDDHETTVDPKACPGWEVWQDCSGNDCRELSCEDPVHGGECKDCTSGCYCGEGYFRNPLGNCVNWDHCPRE